MHTMHLKYLILSIIICIGYCCDPSCNQYLSNIDFNEGTLRITNPGVYCLSEDIIFNPFPSPISNPNADYGWFPFNDDKYPGCATLTGGAYGLGYFAAITIETDSVEINLCGYEISQSWQFNFQQRHFNIIEIAKAPFEFGAGPTDFGGLDPVDDIFIHNGKLGLSSHNGIHSNSASNVRLENLEIYDFEVGGIQLNGADTVIIKNIDIGPSNHNLKPTASYSNAKFVSLALKLLFDAITYDPSEKYINLKGRTLSLQTIYDNLIESMDIGFRYFLQANTKEDMKSDLYRVSVDLYANQHELPDGSALYGLLLHSFSWAVFGLGQERNDEGDGENMIIENVQIHDLKLHTNEFPTIYFDECIDPESDQQTFIKGPFGDTMDIRKMVKKKHRNIIDDGGDITKLWYMGNPLDDARIALALLGPEYSLEFSSVGLENKHFFGWVLDEYEGISHDTLPGCAAFVCNGDIMFHNVKGLMAFRADLIENVEINGLEIRKLRNTTPLSSFACGPYDGPHDGGHPDQLEGWGGLATSVKGMSIYGGDLTFKGCRNKIFELKSSNGDVVGIHAFKDAMILFDDEGDNGESGCDGKKKRGKCCKEGRIMIDRMETCSSLNMNDIRKLTKNGEYPYPNDCFQCNILEDPMDGESIVIDPNPPNGVDKLYCVDIKGKSIEVPIPRTKYEARRNKLYYHNGREYRNLNWDPLYQCGGNKKQNGQKNKNKGKKNKNEDGNKNKNGGKNKKKNKEKDGDKKKKTMNKYKIWKY